jgi:hypothetical protein
VKLTPLIQMPTTWTGTADRFGVHLYHGKLTISDMEQLEIHGRAWHRKNSGDTVELVIIFPSDARMTNEERVRMGQLIKRWQHRRAASATTILAEGLSGAMQRSVLTGLFLLAPPPHPAKVFGSISDAVKWLLPHVQSVCGPETTRAVVQSAVDEFCDAFQRRSVTDRPASS